MHFSFKLLDVQHQSALEKSPALSKDDKAKGGMLLVNLKQLTGFDVSDGYGINVELAQTTTEAAAKDSPGYKAKTTLSENRVGHPGNKLCQIPAGTGLQC